MDISGLGEVMSPEEMKQMRLRLLGCLKDHLLERSDAIPIACRIRPDQQASEIQKSWFSNVQNVVLYLENYGVMIRTTVDKVLNLLNQREPWQDYDVCIFDKELTWCAAVSHNDEAKFLRFPSNF